MTTAERFANYNAQRIAAIIPDHSEPIYAAHWVDCNDEIFNQPLTSEFPDKEFAKIYEL